MADTPAPTSHARLSPSSSSRWLEIQQAAIVGYRPIPSFPKYYVDQVGRLLKLNKDKRLRPFRRLTPRIDAIGYVSAMMPGQKRTRVHVLVAEAWIGPRPDGHHVDHKNGVRVDNHFRNLQYLSPASHLCKTYQSGERKTKLTAEQVQEIRRRLHSGETSHALAIEFGINRGTISNIRHRQIWKHV